MDARFYSLEMLVLMSRTETKHCCTFALLQGLANEENQ